MDKSGSMFALTNLKSGSELNYTSGFKNTGIFLVVVSGAVKINIVLRKRDGGGISETDSFTIAANEDSELLAIEIPMK